MDAPESKVAGGDEDPPEAEYPRSDPQANRLQHEPVDDEAGNEGLEGHETVMHLPPANSETKHAEAALASEIRSEERVVVHSKVVDELVDVALPGLSVSSMSESIAETNASRERP